jgi:hypothetical protein
MYKDFHNIDTWAAFQLLTRVSPEHLQRLGETLRCRDLHNFQHNLAHTLNVLRWHYGIPCNVDNIHYRELRRALRRYRRHQWEVNQPMRLGFTYTVYDEDE